MAQRIQGGKLNAAAYNRRLASFAWAEQRWAHDTRNAPELESQWRRDRLRMNALFTKVRDLRCPTARMEPSADACRSTLHHLATQMAPVQDTYVMLHARGSTVISADHSWSSAKFRPEEMKHLQNFVVIVNQNGYAIAAAACSNES